MKISGLVRLSCAAAAVVFSTLPLSSAGNAADVFQRRTTAAVNFPTTGGQWTTVLHVTIPAGAWIVHAKASPVSFANISDYVRCQLRIGTKQLDASTTQIGGVPAAATVVTQAAFATTGTKIVVFECEHDYGIPGEYLDPGASLLVVRAPGPLG
jgi:hypothetical protein